MASTAQTIRTDNGVPFASAHALLGLSRLSVWWLRLGIEIERIKPGWPQQNGRHERMHLTLKQEATKPASSNFLHQQGRFDRFIEIYNRQRVHSALDYLSPDEYEETCSGQRRAAVLNEDNNRICHPV